MTARLAVMGLVGLLLEPGVAADRIPLQPIIDAAPAGAVITLAPGTYTGAVIDRPLTLTGREAVVDADGAGSTLVVTAPDVVVRGLTVRNSGTSLLAEDAAVSADRAPRLVVEDAVFEDVLFGVFLRQSPDAILRNTVIGAKDLDAARRGDAIRLWESDRVRIEGNTVTGGRDSVAFFSDDIVIRGNHVSGGRYGLHLMYASGALVEGNRLEGNSVGAFVMYSEGVVFRDNLVVGSHGPSGYGLGLKDVDDTHVADNRFVGNRVGIYLDNAPIAADGSQEFHGNLIAHNRTGILFTPAVRGNAFWGNAFVENRAQVGVSGSGTLVGNTWTVAGIGNHWDDFAGYDADGDGIGDIPYRLADLYWSAADRNPAIGFFAGTPAAYGVSLMARMFPTLRPDPIVVDHAPLVRAPSMTPLPLGENGSSPWVLAVASLAMLLMAATLGVMSRPRWWSE